MFRIVIILVFVILVSSCGTNYYIAQIDSTDPYLEKNEDKKFVLRSDSLEIRYSFYGENAPLTIEVFNKMKRNLFIDWNNSFFILGDNEQNRVNLAEFVDYKDHMTCMYPFTYDRKKLFSLSNLKLHKLKKDQFKEEEVRTNTSFKILKTANFTEETTPLFMRGYLALRVENSYSEPVIYPQEFYIKKVFNTNGMYPRELTVMSDQQNDHFYVKHVKGKAVRNIFNVTGTVLLGAAVVAVAVALPADEVIED